MMRELKDEGEKIDEYELKELQPKSL